MDVMELVENKPTVRPFQCDWQTCSKVCMLSVRDIGATLIENYRALTESLTSRDTTEYTQMSDHILA
jgi:hypothetical protein